MILGIGMDMVDIARVERAAARYGERFFRRMFTRKELEHCFRKKCFWDSLAARVAVKEAAFKALGCGWTECGGFTSVEVMSETGGRPAVLFHGKAARLAEECGAGRAHVAITHEAGFAAAVVVLER